mmetsp:Transcript_29044/g.53376  ORF Transcript_29044/g.53376 Transcript_29044/m.53376 type:complete len:210 (+) Transcript_29044:1297-1926(+)
MNLASLLGVVHFEKLARTERVIITITQLSFHTLTHSTDHLLKTLLSNTVVARLVNVLQRGSRLYKVFISIRTTQLFMTLKRSLKVNMIRRDERVNTFITQIYHAHGGFERGLNSRSLQSRPEITGDRLTQSFGIIARIARRSWFRRNCSSGIKERIRLRSFGFKLSHHWSLLVGFLDSLDISSVSRYFPFRLRIRSFLSRAKHVFVSLQ